MTKNRGPGSAEKRPCQFPPELKITPENRYSKSRHFEATRGDRIPPVSEIMPDAQTYSNFATWTSANTSDVTFKLMSIGMIDRMNVMTNVRTTVFIIG